MRRSMAGRAGLVLASSAISLALAELLLRSVGLGPTRFVAPRHLESADKRAGLDTYPDDPRDAFPLDLRDRATREAWRARGLAEAIDAHWERTPHAVGLEYGPELCRGGEIAPRREDRARVVAIGDSFTEGQGVPVDDVFATHLARSLGVEVLNCGRRGQDFPALAESFDRRLALEPDVVLYAMVLNDPERSDAFHARQAFLDDWILDRRRMLSEDGADGISPWTPVLFALVEDRWEGMRVGAETTRWYQEMVEEPNRAGWERTLEHVARMDAAMRARGGALVVAIWPLLVELGERYPFERVHEIVARDLGARGIRVIDALPSFRGEDAAELWVHDADRHPNGRAHAIFARAIEPAVRDALGARRSGRAEAGR